MEITKNNLQMCNEFLAGKDVKYYKFNGIKIFYTPDVYAGGAEFGQDYKQFIIENKLKPKRVFEWCAGAGFIGFSLLANGLCETLCLADINMEAVACCLKTIHENKLYKKVTLYHSDCFDSIPKSEKWDLIVGNPPHFNVKLNNIRATELLYRDKGWNLHQRFYQEVGEFLSDDGLILLQENSEGSNCETFRAMVKKNGFKIIHSSFVPNTTIYYLGCVKKTKSNSATGNKGIALWNKAKKIIPGGSQLLSKRSEMFLPKHWPSYYKKAKGVEIIDLDNNKYVDMSLMGVGSCVLGYADNDVNKKVKEAIDNGSMSTLNSPEEVVLSKLLIEIHPWAQMVRFARTGGEAAAIAIRIARAFTKKAKVAFCGYHGWHDWYLASNLSSNKNLVGHLLPGLNPEGVPPELINTALPFHYNKIEELKNIVKKNDIGVIIMEPSRHEEPQKDFLEKVRIIADKIGAILIFDEISSGFRRNIGGVHLQYKVIPDMAVFGKALSNGYPMSAVIGKREVMEEAQETFISSTYWTERIGPVAALATIKKMKRKKVPQYLDKIGSLIGQGWEKLAKKYSLNISIGGPNQLINFSFNYKNSLEIKTLFTQEMLKRGFLASSTVYVSYSHTKKQVKDYLAAVDKVFDIISKAIKENNVEKLLDGPVAHSGFQRLT